MNLYSAGDRRAAWHLHRML